MKFKHKGKHFGIFYWRNGWKTKVINIYRYRKLNKNYIFLWISFTQIPKCFATGQLTNKMLLWWKHKHLQKIFIHQNTSFKWFVNHVRTHHMESVDIRNDFSNCIARLHAWKLHIHLRNLNGILSYKLKNCKDIELERLIYFSKEKYTMQETYYK